MCWESALAESVFGSLEIAPARDIQSIRNVSLP